MALVGVGLLLWLLRVGGLRGLPGKGAGVLALGALLAWSWPVEAPLATPGIGAATAQAEGDWQPYDEQVDSFHLHVVQRSSEHGKVLGRLAIALVHLLGVEDVSRQMNISKEPVVVSIGSIQQVKPHSHMLVYAGTKAALNALCRALAVELARYGVTANAILPGWIKSDMTAGVMANDKFVANVMPRIPVRHFGEPSDFGGIAVYIMSKASSYHTADCFVIDGGYTVF